MIIRCSCILLSTCWLVLLCFFLFFFFGPFPLQIWQPGPRDAPIQCFIKRERTTSTYRLYLGLSPGKCSRLSCCYSQTTTYMRMYAGILSNMISICTPTETLGWAVNFSSVRDNIALEYRLLFVYFLHLKALYFLLMWCWNLMSIWMMVHY